MTFSAKRKPVRSRARSRSRKRHNSGRRSSKHAATHRRPGHSRKAARKSASRSRQNHGSRRLRGGVHNAVVAAGSVAATVLAGFLLRKNLIDYYLQKLQTRIKTLVNLDKNRSSEQTKELTNLKKRMTELMQFLVVQQKAAKQIQQQPNSPQTLNAAKTVNLTGEHLTAGLSLGLGLTSLLSDDPFGPISISTPETSPNLTVA
jgi:hypothetical protein